MKSTTYLPAIALAKAGLALFLLFCVNVAMAQTIRPERRPGEIIIQLEPGSNIQNTLSELNRNVSGAFSLKTTLAKEWNVYLLQVEENQDNS